MSKQTPGKIFLADQRGVLETQEFRRYSTFSFGAYQNEHKAPFGPLYGVNEETLAGAHCQEIVAYEASYVVVLPITGAVEVSASAGLVTSVEAEQLLTIAVPAGTVLRLRNPYAEELITFLHLWLKAPNLSSGPAYGLTTVFDWQQLDNHLCELVSFREASGQSPVFPEPLPFALRLGRFAGRQEAVYQLTQGTQLFVFVIAGAFEIEGRLLHENDGLALWNVEAVELEALSHNALGLVIELAE